MLNKLLPCPAILLVLFLLLPHASQAQETVFFPIVVKKETASNTSPIPDTGIYFCQNGTDKIECPKSGEAFYGQDAHYNHPARQHRYTDNGDGTVTDEVTGLMWMQADDGNTYTWENAISYCDNFDPPDVLAAGHPDWRLPEITELRTLRDLGRSNPAIDPVFSSCQSNLYWSSSPSVGLSGVAWLVNFYGGVASLNVKGNTYYVRCVRSGP